MLTSDQLTQLEIEGRELARKLHGFGFSNNEVAHMAFALLSARLVCETVQPLISSRRRRDFAATGRMSFGSRQFNAAMAGVELFLESENS